MVDRRRRGGGLPDKVVAEQLSVQPHGLQHVVSNLAQQPSVLPRGLGGGVATFVRAELQQNCEGRRKGREQDESRMF